MFRAFIVGVALMGLSVMAFFASPTGLVPSQVPLYVPLSEAGFLLGLSIIIGSIGSIFFRASQP